MAITRATRPARVGARGAVLASMTVVLASLAVAAAATRARAGDGATPAERSHLASLEVVLCGYIIDDGDAGTLRLGAYSSTTSEAFASTSPGGFTIGAAITSAQARGLSSVRTTFHDLEPGPWAVRAYHDRNGNRALDRGSLLPTPTEPFGFSGAASARLGPPSFAEAAVELAPGANRIEIRLHDWSLRGESRPGCD